MVIWKDVDGFEGLYKVSSEGVVVGTPRTGTKGGVVKWYKTTHGYMEYHLCKNGKRHHMSTHRLVAKHFIPNPNNKPFVNHIDGNKLNNNVENLEWVTHEENMQHAVRTGLLNNKGNNHPRNKLTDKEVYQIRELHRYGIYNQKEISEIYNVTPANINYIVRNITRKAAGN